MAPDRPPTAEGDLSFAPLAHLMVYALDHRISGELHLEPAEGVVHVLRFDQGVPSKLRFGEPFARLGDLLVEAGVTTREVVEGAASMGGLLGDLLVLTGSVDSKTLEETLEKQLRMRLMKLYELPPATKYRYYDGAKELDGWGAEPLVLEPLELLWAGLEAHGDVSALLEPTLARVQEMSLSLHPKAPLERVALSDVAKALVELLQLDPMTLPQILEAELGPEPEVRKLVYAFVLCRFFDLGHGSLPLGVRARPQQLAKVRLKSVLVPEARTSLRPASLRSKGVIPRDEESIPPPAVSDEGPAIEVGEADEELEDIEVLEGVETEQVGLLARVPPPPAASEQGDDQAPSADDDAPESGMTARGGSPAHEADSAPEQECAPEAESAPEAVSAPELEASAEESGEDSSRRIVSEAVRGLALEALLALTLERLDEKDAEGAAEVYDVAKRRLDEGGKLEPASLRRLHAAGAWARMLLPGSNLKALSLELDELIREADDEVLPRWVRAQIRRKLGDGAGASSDLKRVLQLEPEHAAASKELAALKSIPPPKREQPGLLRKLFGR